MWDGHRGNATWRFTLLDRRDRPIGRLDGVKGGSLSVKALSTLGMSGSLELDYRQEFDRLNSRLRVEYDAGIPGAPVIPMGVLLMNSPADQRDGFTRSTSIELLSKLTLLQSGILSAGYSLAAGTNIIETVVSLIESVGETRIAHTPSDAELPNMFVAEAEDNKLSIINKLLEIAGYWSLWADGTGQFRVEPYVNPQDRATSYRFEEGEASIHSPEWEYEFDDFFVPNVFSVVMEGDDETPAIEGVAVNENPDDPYSTVSRGFEVAERETVEVADQAAADRLAERRLQEARTKVQKLSVTHAIVPLAPNDVVRFISDGMDVRATVQGMDFTFEDDAECKAEWRVVNE